jgi:hypothetical protein
MANAKQELLSHIENKEVKAAKITYDTHHENREFILYKGYTNEELQRFLNNLDFRYDNGYGTQYIYGSIWYEDGTWSKRHEYDGSECWEHVTCPPIPKKELTAEEYKEAIKTFLKETSWTQQGHLAESIKMYHTSISRPIECGTDPFKALASLVQDE